MKSLAIANSLLVMPLLCTAAVAQIGIEQIDTNTDRVPLHTVVPDYPKNARRDRIEGEVQVCFDISRNGMPMRIAVRRSSNRIFEKPSRKAIRNSTWVALNEDAAAPNIKACRTFRFTLVPVPEDERD